LFTRVKQPKQKKEESKDFQWSTFPNQMNNEGIKGEQWDKIDVTQSKQINPIDEYELKELSRKKNEKEVSFEDKKKSPSKEEEKNGASWHDWNPTTLQNSDEKKGGDEAEWSGSDDEENHPNMFRQIQKLKN